LALLSRIRCTWYLDCIVSSMIMRRSVLHILLGVLVAGSFAVTPARAEPLDLQDPTARGVLVRFESSPRSEPAALDRDYGPMLPARVESAGRDLLRLIISGAIVEQYLFNSEQPEPGSFGDFVWLFDSRTGDVLDARLEGQLIQTLDWGLVRSTTRARVRARMSTRERAGFHSPRRVLGTRLFRYCDPGRSAEKHCNDVEAVRFDRDRGYVNAVGVIEVQAALGIEVESFSPLGEAVFFEMDTDLGSEGEAFADSSEPIPLPVTPR